MRLLLITCFIFFISDNLFCQDESADTTKFAALENRLHYFKQQHLYVETLAFDASGLSDSEMVAAKKQNNILNENLKYAFAHFWDLNDSIIYIEKNEVEPAKQKDPAGIFITVEDVTKNIKDLTINNPSDSVSLLDLSEPFINGDTSLLLMIEEIRFLRYNLLHGDNINTDWILQKVILVDKMRTGNPRWDSFVDDVMKQYKKGVATVDKNIIIQAVLSKDDRYLYVDHGWLINAEDGSMIVPF